MTEQLRIYISYIRRRAAMSDVPEGYKMSEVGVIPEDWDVKKIENIAPLQRGFDLPNNELENGEYPVVYSNGIVNYHCTYKVKAPGVVTGRSGTIGKVTFVEADYWPHNTSLWVTDFKGNDPKYIYYLYLKINLERFGTGSGVPTLNRNDVHSFKIFFPPTIEEQQAIASALSDMDALIAALGQLITKKRNIKQGAMQQLLTGEKRLPGFGGEWDVKKIGEIANIRKGQLITENTRIEGNIPVIAGGKKPAYYHNKPNRLNNTITISGSGASAGYISYFEMPIFASDCSTLEEGEGYSIKFIFYQLQLRQDDIYKMQTGGAQPHIHPSDIYPLEFSCPQAEEQQAIAQILSDMDTEIETLKQKQAKYKAIKQGMMQELLTGKTRLV
ncbi:MAG TPA: restriction endonuclease subunit S [Methanosarcinaceae archaeon]|nr:restriction endonuclease subunit S [Methanosarcinaceae archaeon]